jgi:zinc transporter ZupT
MNPTVAVFVYGLATALATGLGAIPFLWARSASPMAVAYANAVASGLMLGASFELVAEGTRRGSGATVAGAALGVVFILGAERLLARHPVEFGALVGERSRRALLVLLVMTVHSFAEGVAVGVAFGGGEVLATQITLAIAVHNVPEGLAISAALRSRGAPVLACAGWSVFSSLPQPLMAVPAFAFVDAFESVLPYGLGFAAGAMVFMVLDELLPEAYVDARRDVIGLLVTLSMIAMILTQKFL